MTGSGAGGTSEAGAAAEVVTRPWSICDLQALLSARMRLPVIVRLTRAHRTPIRAEHHGGRKPWLELRLHRAFAYAPRGVLDDLVTWMQHGARASRAGSRLDAWLAESVYRRAPSPRPGAHRPRGFIHDLDELAAPLYAGVFAAELADARMRPALAWGPRRPSRARHSLQLGCHDAVRRVVRVHPVLDCDEVPSWFVALVLHHELLHVVVPPERDTYGRWQSHGPEFRRREGLHPDHERGKVWERIHLPRLIQRARRLGPEPAPPPSPPVAGRLAGGRLHGR